MPMHYYNGSAWKEVLPGGTHTHTTPGQLGRPFKKAGTTPAQLGSRSLRTATP